LTGISTARLTPYSFVSVNFPLGGKQLPADHGYLVYAAISRASPHLHGKDWLAIELISALPAGRGRVLLPDRDATLCLRVPAKHYRDTLQLSGKRLDIGGCPIRLGVPLVRTLEPAQSLYARVVTIKNFTEGEAFLDAVKRKLDQFGIKARVELPRDEQGRYRRRIVTIHGKSVVGFSVAVHDLSDEDSLVLQAGMVISGEDDSIQWQALFSRRAMGCGIFNPIASYPGKQ